MSTSNMCGFLFRFVFAFLNTTRWEAYWEFKEWLVSEDEGSLKRMKMVNRTKHSGKRLVSCVPYLGMQRPHLAGYRPQLCESPWWRQLHQAAPRRYWRWRCCCNCSCSILCGTAAPTPFSNAPFHWMIRKKKGKWRGYTNHVWKEGLYKQNSQKSWDVL